MARNPDFSKYNPSQEILDVINKWADYYGIDRDLAQDIALQESSFDPTNSAVKGGNDGKTINPETGKPYPYSSAAGLFMFTDATWEDAIRNGIVSQGTSKEDPDANAKAAMWFISKGNISKWNASKPVWGKFYSDDEIKQSSNGKVSTTQEQTPIDNKVLGAEISNTEQEQLPLMQPTISSLEKAKKISAAKDNLKMIIESGRTINPTYWNEMFGDVMPYSDGMVEQEKTNQSNLNIQKDWKSRNNIFTSLARPITAIFDPKPVFSAENTKQPQEQIVEDLNMGFLQNAQNTQKFGAKTFSFYGKNGHEGNDFRAAIGTPVRGFQGWIVDFAGQGESYYGNKVVLRNPKTGESVEFAHLKDVAVQKGQTIGKDQVIATTGNSGYRPDGQSQQAHLHVNYYNPSNQKADLLKVAKNSSNDFPMIASVDSVINKAKGIVSGITNPKQVSASEPTATPVGTPKKDVPNPQLRPEQNPNQPGAYYGKSVGTYQIKQGDTLGNIARQFNTTVQDFQRQNPNITNPNIIRAGQSLNVPSAVTDTSKGDGYTIRSGDTLTTIARNLGTTVNDLVRKNGIQNPNLIRAGTKIKV